MMKWVSLGLLLLSTGSWATESAKPKTETFDIQSDTLPIESYHQQERTPFFAENSAGSEVMEEVEELRQELKNLTARVTELEKITSKKQ